MDVEAIIWSKQEGFYGILIYVHAIQINNALCSLHELLWDSSMRIDDFAPASTFDCMQYVEGAKAILDILLL